MSTKGNNWARMVRGVGFAKKAILYSLGERHNIDTELCCPDQKRLAEDSEMSIRALQGHLAELVAMGLIGRQVRCPVKGGKITYYVLHFDRLHPIQGWNEQSAESAPDESDDQSADSDMTKAQLSALSENPNLEPESSVAKATGEDADLFGNDVAPGRVKAITETGNSLKVDSQNRQVEEDPYKRLIFTAGLALFKAHGHREPEARAFLGRLLKMARDDTASVANAITAAEKARPADLRGWLLAAMRKRIPGTPENAAEDDGRRRHELNERFAAFARGARWKTHWGPPPDDPAADYPDEFYARHNVMRWEAAS